MVKFKRVLVANRGEIAIRVFRACKELGIRTVAIYSNEDKYSLFRTKADESYQIGEGKGPVDAYLNIEEIINLAVKKGVDAIHPGYGFLSENPEFAKRCEQEGIEFIGPTSEMMAKMGDKIKCKDVARGLGVPIIVGYDGNIKTVEEAKKHAAECGYPLIFKAAAGGGGRGMRIVRKESDLEDAFLSAKNEAKKAFGIDHIFMEKFVENPKHIEVQVVGDKYGNIVHMFERDCSIQRRYQKIVEFAPAFSVPQEIRNNIHEDAMKIAKAVQYRSAGTLEFLVDKQGNHYFIEMNPRIQVEHTVTEMITGIDIVQAQVLIAQGYALNSPEIGIHSQEDIKINGYSIQCRITTEDPSNNFAPDTGKIESYRTGSGFGIRLDGGNGFTGAIISPYYDSLLVKNISWSRNFHDAIKKSIRSISESYITGVKTNIGFVVNILNHPTFMSGECNTGFIEENPELFSLINKTDTESRVLKYLGDIVVNETQGVKEQYDVPKIPKINEDSLSNLRGTKQILDSQGAAGLMQWVKDQKKVLLTDTTMRDAHQSLMATRVRSKDMIKIAKATSVYGKDLFSLEMWGGATFDVAYRFLKESPWVRLEELRNRIPNILFQMLLRGPNAVGYKNYPDNVIRGFIKESAASGIDVFRIFDSMNEIRGMEISIDEVMNNGKIAEACMCYTGNILDSRREKFSLDYYVKLAKDIEKTGAQILGIKDMSSLLKPYAASKLISVLKNEIGIPIHLHTHDTTGNGVATVLMAIEAGVDIVDTAINSMSGLTSQPALNSVAAALRNLERDPLLDTDGLQKLSDYWESVRPVYSKYESGLKSNSAEIYKYEIPGGQYSNLKPQVESFGLGHKFNEIKEMYKVVNEMLGDIIKVTPTSKMVGDFAIFMVQNDLTPENIFQKAANMAFPDSVVSYFKGMIGQPLGGFPVKLQKLVLRGEKAITVRPGEMLPDEDFDRIEKLLKDKYNLIPTPKEILSYALYPEVFEGYLKNFAEYGDLSWLGSDVFFHGLSEGEIIEAEVGEGNSMMVKLLTISNPDFEGYRTLVFEVNRNRREIKIKDKNYVDINSVRKSGEYSKVEMVDPENKNEIGSPIPGSIGMLMVKEGDKVTEGQPLVVVEAMKMETKVTSPMSGLIKSIYIKEGQEVKAGELLLIIK